MTAAASPPAAAPTPAAPGFDDDAFAQVYTENVQAVYYLALRLLGNSAQAEDAAHDVFVRAYRSWDRFRGEASVRTWLYRITLNLCQNLQRSWHQRHILTGLDDSLYENPSPGAPSPLRVLETRELGQRIQQTLEALPEEYRLLLLLVADEKLSYQEVAGLTGQTTDAVRGKLHRARRAFATAFARTA